MVVWMFQLDFQYTRFLAGHMKVLPGVMWMFYDTLSRDQILRGPVRNMLGYSRAWVFVLTADAHHLYVSILI
jgi:hypothetical protein